MQNHEIKYELEIAWKKVVHHYKELRSRGEFKIILYTDFPMNVEFIQDTDVSVLAERIYREIL